MSDTPGSMPLPANIGEGQPGPPAGAAQALWAGALDEARRRRNVSVRRPNSFGDLSWRRARIADKRVDEGAYFVDLEVLIENHLVEITARGTAMVELPSRGADAVRDAPDMWAIGQPLDRQTFPGKPR